MLYVSDVAHLVHVAVSEAINCNTPLAISSWKFVIKMGAIFKHSPKVFAAYSAVCDELEEDATKMPSVVPVRWNSFLTAVDAVARNWPQIKAFLEHQDGVPRAGEKIRAHTNIQFSRSIKAVCIFVIPTREADTNHGDRKNT